MRMHPLPPAFRSVLIAAALVLGEIAGFLLPAASLCWPLAAIAAFAATIAIAGWNAKWQWSVVAAAIAGMALAGRAEAMRAAAERRASTTDGDCRPPGFELPVAGEPSFRHSAKKGCLFASFPSSLCGIPVRVVAPLDADRAAPAPGDVWKCSGWLSKRKGARHRYSAQTLWVVSADDAVPVSRATRFSPGRAYAAVSGRLAQFAGNGLSWSREIASLNGAMLLGRRSGVPSAQRAIFAAAGTVHVFAISGLHIMLAAAMINLLLAAAGAGCRTRSAAAIPLVAAYVMLTGARPSAIRAAMMCSLWFGARLAGRKPDTAAALGGAAIAVYGFSPQMVFDAGCTLSFAVMAGITLWLRLTARLANPADMLLEDAAEESALGGRERMKPVYFAWRVASGIFSALGISFAAWIAGAPVAARVFGRLAGGGIFANLLAVPLAAMSVVFGAAGTALTPLSRAAGAMMNNLAGVCICAMERISGFAASIPYLSLETLPWSWFECLLWYACWAALALTVAPHFRRKTQIKFRSWEM